MNDTQKKFLLRTAGDTIRAVVTGKDAEKIEVTDDQLNANCGCFVTLKNNDRLRGCLGQFTSEKPLSELVVEMARASATSDPRFLADPITADELQQLDIEISVLSPLRRVDDPLSLRLGIDGIYIKRGCACGCFLPQVATETGWTREEFLSYCCSHKAGLPENAWQDGDTEVYFFTAEVFGSPFNEI
jgi:AmmeMemoRadiSam system protein A